MKFNLNTEQYELINKNIVEPIEAIGAKVYCYGSRARGDNHPFSDLDLMIEPSSGVEINPGPYLEFVEKSNFPYKVDLVCLPEFAEAYLEGYQRDKIPYKAL